MLSNMLPGTRLGAYEIRTLLGAGGMGVVYRAADTRLGRDVAIKVLRPGLALDTERRKRFEQEARAASALNHPNIVTIYDIGEHEGTRFIAMEYVDGGTLRELLAEGPLPARKLLDLAKQIAEGLAKAHAAGIVHRDLKPENIMVSRDGYVKILDFGLAKLRPEPSRVDSEMATLERLQTGEGIVVGTVAYMSPEQAKGLPVDFRSDQFSLGAILYEMATGKRPFQRPSSTETLAAILGQEPEPVAIQNPSVPPHLATIVERCLSKDPQDRYDSSRDIAKDLHWEELATTARPSTRYPLATVGIVGVLAVVLVTMFGLLVPDVRDWISGQAPKIESIAVLPLKNLMGDPEQEYFVEGMHEALTAELSKISALKVISRTSAMRYKDTHKPLPQVAQELNVDGVIEGSVLREGEQVRITVQLIHGASDRHLWAQSFDRELRGVLALHSEVARAIASQVRVTVTPQEQARLASARAANPKAYEAYLLGRHYWNQRTIHGYKQAVETFRKAVEQDPGYAPAYAGLADSYILQGEQGGLPQKEARSLAEAAIRKALDLDETLAEAHASLGWWTFYYEWNWAQAEQAFKRAIELNPGDALARARYGRSLGYLGRFEQAMRELQRARELDPLSIPTNAYLGQGYFFAKQYDRAAEQLQQTLELNPNHPLTRHNLGELYLAQGRFAEAIPELERSVELSGQFFGVPSSHFLAILGCTYARATRTERAVKILNELEQRSQQGLASAFDMASLYVALGEKERALVWLERGYEQRDVWLVGLKAWPWFDLLQDDARFQALLARMNFPPN